MVNHLHLVNILLHPRGLELVLLLVRREVVDGVLQLDVVVTAPGGDGLPGGVSHNIVVRCPISWTCVPADHLGPMEDLHNGLELHSSWTRDSLDPILGSSGDAQVSQQSLKASVMKD
jgi:hypothetical protein